VKEVGVNKEGDFSESEEKIVDILPISTV